MERNQICLHREYCSCHWATSGIIIELLESNLAVVMMTVKLTLLYFYPHCNNYWEFDNYSYFQTVTGDMLMTSHSNLTRAMKKYKAEHNITDSAEHNSTCSVETVDVEQQHSKSLTNAWLTVIVEFSDRKETIKRVWLRKSGLHIIYIKPSNMITL